MLGDKLNYSKPPRVRKTFELTRPRRRPLTSQKHSLFFNFLLLVFRVTIAKYVARPRRATGFRYLAALRGFINPG
jgi:hypothetical protein